MKNANKHAEDLRSLFKRLLKDAKPDTRQAQDPLKALVRGAMSYDVSDARADEAVRAIEKEFVDLNELRVATELEIHEMLGVKYPAIEKRVATITHALNSIFEKEHTLSLERLRAMSKRDARQFLRDLPGITPFVEAYVMLMSFDGHAVPADNEIFAYLRDQRIVEDGTSLDDCQKFLEHAVRAEESYELYTSLRRVAHSEETAKPKKKAKA